MVILMILLYRQKRLEYRINYWNNSINVIIHTNVDINILSIPNKIIVDVTSKVNNTIPSNKKHMLKNKIINKMKINNNVQNDKFERSSNVRNVIIKIILKTIIILLMFARKIIFFSRF